ncbi:MAG: cupin domain-containing protein [Candidatus Sabulitectum sp.]|nr:cupin domain-containing protein [Candidatus Sabulitectum sp.]
MIIRSKGIQTTRKSLFDGKGEAEIETLFVPDEFEAPVRLCARVKLAPGCSIGLHQHIDEDELYFIIEGAGEVSDGDSKSPVSSGHSILTRSGESHFIENTGSGDLVLIAVIPQAHTQ